MGLRGKRRYLGRIGHVARQGGVRSALALGALAHGRHPAGSGGGIDAGHKGIVVGLDGIAEPTGGFLTSGLPGGRGEFVGTPFEIESELSGVVVAVSYTHLTLPTTPYV